ncbi:hypothetical protein [Amaricoccus tamworthensis]|uniref:hypothetical protein n=1 Tax=Amaricoccus tamworthensis TaxID=57002 RepID=UPI003C7AD733
MSGNPDPAPHGVSGSRFVLGALGLTLRILVKSVLTLALILVALLIAVLDRNPDVPEPALPDVATASIAADMARELQEFSKLPPGQVDWTLSAEELDAGTRMLHRFFPVARVEARVSGEKVTVHASVSLGRWIDGLWTNVRFDVPETTDGLDLENLRVGYLPMPVKPVVSAASKLGDRYVAPGFVESLLETVVAVEAGPETVTATLDLSGPETDTFSQKIRDLLRNAVGLEDIGPVHEWLWYINKAANLGLLPRGGSVLPYIRFIMTGNQVRGAAKQDIKAALMALAVYCGDTRLSTAFGMSPSGSVKTNCDGTTLGGRDDLKRHFLVSAGLRAARSDDTAMNIGEMKELLDSNSGRTGFSFDDMAANAAGIRLGETLMSLESDEIESLGARIEKESDILPSLEGLPAGLSEAEFVENYGSTDSDAYRSLTAEINRRIDGLPIYAGEGG